MNVRPAVLYRGVQSPLALRRGEQIDMMVVRENTEGEYSQVGGFVYHEQPEEIAIQTSVFTRRGTERVIRYAFELARKRNKKNRVTSVTKSNAQGVRHGAMGSHVCGGRFRISGHRNRIAAGGCRGHEFHSPARKLRCRSLPRIFSVTSLSDISAILVGSMGPAPSANHRPHPAAFLLCSSRCIGSAPDIAGKGMANPLAAIFSVAMMLEHLGMPAAAKSVNAAVAAVLAESKLRTPDLGGTSKTSEVTGGVLVRLGLP